MKKILAALLLTAVPFISNANSRWVFVASADDESESWYYDVNTVQKSGDSLTLWIRRNYQLRSPQGVLSLKVQDTINCRTRERINRYIMAYDEIDNNGKLIDSFHAIDPKWRPIPPETMSMELFKVVCKK